jgi:hypothetical protein
MKELDTSDPGARAELTDVNARHLMGLELNAMPYTVDGIPILRMYTYELVQIVNHAWLAVRTTPDESDASHA